MNHLAVRFCVGCGYLCDEHQTDGGQARWVNAHEYLTRYGFRWEDLDRTDDACPPCARVFACARRGVPPEVAETAERV